MKILCIGGDFSIPHPNKHFFFLAQYQQAEERIESWFVETVLPRVQPLRYSHHTY